MTEIAVFLSAAAVAFGISRLAGIPVVAMLVATGLAISMFVKLPTNVLQTSMELGLSFLVFSMGIELSPERFKTRMWPIAVISLGQILAVGFCSFIITTLAGFSWQHAVLISLALSASSTIAVVRHLRKRSQLYEPFARLVLGVLLIQDTLMTVLLVLWQKWEQNAGLGQVAFSLAFILLLAVTMHQFIIPWLVRKYADDSELTLLIALAVLFGFLGLSDLLNLPTLAGAFAAGFSLSAFPVNGLMRAQLGSITDFFLAFFFIAVGELITIPGLKGLLTVVALVFMLFVITPPVVMIISERFGISTRSSIESGLLLAQAGELSLAAALFSLSAGRIDSEIFSIIALTTVISMAITPLIATDSITFKLMHYRPFARIKNREFANYRGHIIIVGYGTVGKRILPDLMASKRPVIIIDDDSKVVAELRKQGKNAMVGDCTNIEVLNSVALTSAHTVFTFSRRLDDSLFLLRQVNTQQVRVIVRVFDDLAAQAVQDAGGIALNTMQDAVDSFLAWLGSDYQRLMARRLTEYKAS
ncbi:MAG: cation:proton antiporter [Leptospiraceae bacterium]|nr:cation:proton antiporter [Leptospiraceae bacterium]MCB1201650.1 cation:proton antiporter [Leptospiraceae bacterium]